MQTTEKYDTCTFVTYLCDCVESFNSIHAPAPWLSGEQSFCCSSERGEPLGNILQGQQIDCSTNSHGISVYLLNALG